MTAMLSDALTLTADELQALADRVGVQEFPTVLAVRQSHATIDKRDAAFDCASRVLASRNLITGGAVHPDVETMLHTLNRPDRELAMRLITPDGAARVSVVRRGPLCVLARRIADLVTVRIVSHGTESAPAVSALTAELPKAGPANVQPVGAPLTEMAETLSDTGDPAA